MKTAGEEALEKAGENQQKSWWGSWTLKQAEDETKEGEEIGGKEVSEKVDGTERQGWLSLIMGQQEEQKEQKPEEKELSLEEKLKYVVAVGVRLMLMSLLLILLLCWCWCCICCYDVCWC